MENRRVQMTKRLLKNALIEMLEEGVPIGKVYIRDLCNRAEINRSTFYKYYGSQYDLLEETESDFIHHLSVHLEGAIADSSVFYSLCKYLDENLKLARVLINNNADAKFAEKIFRLPVLLENYKILFGHRFDRNELEYPYIFFTHGGFYMIRAWLNKDNREPTEEFSELIVKLLGRFLDVQSFDFSAKKG